MSLLRRARLVAEMAVLFLVAPFVVMHVVYVERVPLLQVLAVVIAIFFVIFLLDRSFPWRATFLRGFGLGELLRILALFAVLGGALTAYAAEYHPRTFLSFPNRVPDLWLKVMILYPLASVTAQELIFRVFFTHRYAAALGGSPWLVIPVSAALFAFSHIIFNNWQAVAISFAGGLLFAYRYHRTKSFWATFVEHSLYGNLIFTIGLGRYFFTGVANV